MPIPDIVKWNGIKDVKKLYVGQKLIVAKGRPDEPTEAELAAKVLKVKDQVREASADDAVKAALAAAEAKMKAANNTTMDTSKLNIDDHLEKSNLANRILAGEGALLPEEYMEVDKEKVAEENKAHDFTSLTARIRHNGKTKEALKEKKDEKKGWEEDVKKDAYDPSKDPDAKRKIGDSLAMFILSQIVDDHVKDVVKECTANDMFDESLSGRFYQFHKGKKPTYKANRRVSNALDFANAEDLAKLLKGGGDNSTGGLKSISRGEEEDDASSMSSKRSRGSMLSRMKEWESPDLSHNVRTIAEGDEEEGDEGGGGGGGKKKKKKIYKKCQNTPSRKNTYRQDEKTEHLTISTFLKQLSQT